MKKFYSLIVILAALAVFAGYQTVNIGTNPNDGTGDTVRNAFIKVNSNFAQVTADFVSATNRPGYGLWLTNWDSRYVFFTNSMAGGGGFQWSYALGGQGITLDDLGFTVSTNFFVSDIGMQFVPNAASPPWVEGRVFYDSTEKTLAYYNENNNMTVNVGQETVIRVDNKTGSNIPEMSAVYISGAHGHNPEITLAVATNEAKSYILGVTTTWVTNNGSGYVTSEGMIHGLNTKAIGEDGATVFLSTNVPGGLTTNDCSAPFHSVSVGIIAYSHVNQGILFVSPHFRHVTASNITDLSNFRMTATNYSLTAPQWIDVPVLYAFSGTGPSAPSLTAVTNGSVIQALAMDNTDILYAQGQFPHNIAITNAVFPKFYVEPHIHFSTTGGAIDSTHSNVTFQVEWEMASIGSYYNNRGTNIATFGVTTDGFHYLGELGHITNTIPSGISTVFRCRLTRPASALRDIGNGHLVLIDSMDVHVPVGNSTAIGSREDNSQN
jgi:hypothetical protein